MLIKYYFYFDFLYTEKNFNYSYDLCSLLFDLWIIFLVVKLLYSGMFLNFCDFKIVNIIVLNEIFIQLMYFEIYVKKFGEFSQ